MEFRRLGGSGLKVPVLSFGTGTFGGGTELFKAWGTTDVAEATRLVDICLDAGVNMFDSADIYSNGAAEEILGQAIAGRRDRVLISTKATFRAARARTTSARRATTCAPCRGSLKRLQTDYIDLFQLHGFDAMTPVEETLRTLDDLVRAGKIRYIGCSNFSGWHLMKSLADLRPLRLARYVAHQAYYSLLGRDYEWELMPLALDQGRRRGLEPARLGPPHRQDPPRRSPAGDEPPEELSVVAIDDRGQRPADRRRRYVFRVVDALDAVALTPETGKTRAPGRDQLAAAAADAWRAWTSLSARATTEQLRDNLGRGRLGADAGASRRCSTPPAR
jgi:diketogulonate reductase-like aldo/keto reductase